MADNGALGRVMSLHTEDISLCADLLLTISATDEADLPACLSAIAVAVLECGDGGFHADGMMAPAGKRLIEEVNFEGRRYGCYAFDAPLSMRPRLVALARYTAIALAQRRQEGYYRQIINQIYDSVIVMDMAGFITGWNNGAERMFGYSAEEAMGRNILFLYADDEEVALLGDEFSEHGGREMEMRHRRKSGEIFWARLTLSQMRDAQGVPFGVIGYLTDITERRENRQRLLLHAKIFEQSGAGIVITDRNCRILSVNPAFTAISGYSGEEVTGFSALRWTGSALLQEIQENLDLNGGWESETLVRHKQGHDFPAHFSVSAVPSAEGQPSHLIWIVSDVSERKEAAARIHHLAYYDSVTDLPNRSLLVELTEQALAEARRDGNSGALMFIDLDRFKPINDTLGHKAGNALLREVGARFREVVRDGDVVARIGDDEFVVALFDHAHSANSGAAAQRLLDALNAPFNIDGHELHIAASIGISIYPDDGRDVEGLLRQADIALYRAKQTGGNSYVYYSEEMNERSQERLRVEAGLRRALENDELVVYYQPKVNLADGLIIGAEALVRWRHPELGLVQPAAFIPIAEESELIVDIGNWVLEAACTQARLWQRKGLPPLRIAVNLSARQFGPSLAKRVSDLLRRHDLPAAWLELEITESMLMNSAEQVIKMMDTLTGMGVSLSLDDFGTGYSSLSYLKRFPIETIKIDRSFIKGTPQDKDDCAIAAAIVSMSKQLKLRVIAEGVETVAQADFMRGVGCDEIQGYLISPPVAAEKFEAMLWGDGGPRF